MIIKLRCSNVFTGAFISGTFTAAMESMSARMDQMRKAVVMVCTTNSALLLLLLLLLFLLFCRLFVFVCCCCCCLFLIEPVVSLHLKRGLFI